MNRLTSLTTPSQAPFVCRLKGFKAPSLLWLVLLLAVAPLMSVHAQVELGGTADLALMKAGNESSYVRNGIFNDFRHAHLQLHQLNLFAFASPDPAFSFTGRLQFDNKGNKTAPPQLTLAMLEWMPENHPYQVTLGRFISPMGLYPRRQLELDNLFGEGPLLYRYFVNISDLRGYWPLSGTTTVYGDGDVGLPAQYYGGYTTGGLFSWTLQPNKAALKVALTNGPPATTVEQTNQENVAVLAKLELQPAIYWQQGFSVGYGTFMQADTINATLDDLQRYQQLVVNTDFILGYTYFEVSGELAYTRWHVPSFRQGAFVTESDDDAATFTPQQFGGYLDFKYEPPQLTGSYWAVRIERLFFPTVENPVSGADETWEDDVTQLSFAWGYKLSRSILLKLSYAHLLIDDANETETYAFRTFLSVGF